MDSWLCCFLDEGLHVSYLSALPFLSCKMGIPFSMDYGNETEGELGYVSPIRWVQFQRGCSRDLKLSLPLHSRGQVWGPGSGGWQGPGKHRHCPRGQPLLGWSPFTVAM